jgi:nitrogen fixation/metabolism regulation signal transduction histidine kinase
VIKVFEDHHGTVALLDGLERPDGGVGAQVQMIFPMSVAAAKVDAKPEKAEAEG